MEQKVAVIGAGGKMGSWFVNYFSRRNSRINAYDSDRKSLRSLADVVTISGSLSDCARTADLVLVCVPVHVAPQVIRECARAMKSGAVIAEISSVKQKTFRVLKRLRSDVHPLCIHPMYGPGASEKRPLKILIVPVRNEQQESHILRGIFKDAVVTSLPDAKSHDSAIAAVLSLPYFASIVFAKSVAGDDIKRLKRVAGTTFTFQTLLAESVLT
ncbi:MAG: prephenate dehydrogenase/arogenate dehydrogenase family protein, partial [Nitrososphaera sp.]|nr:prephenate dehydrogenase/arogenate dehydrogenase family protein [Nitrososphaera sp.]